MQLSSVIKSRVFLRVIDSLVIHGLCISLYSFLVSLHRHAYFLVILWLSMAYMFGYIIFLLVYIDVHIYQLADHMQSRKLIN